MVAQCDDAGVVDAVAADPLVGRGRAGGGGFRSGGIGRGRSLTVQGAVGSLLVVVGAEGVQLRLQFGQGSGSGLASEPLFEGLVEAFDFPAGLGVVRAGVLLLHPEAGEFLLEAVAGRPAAAAAGEPGRVDQSVVGEHGRGEAVSCTNSAERGEDDGAGDGPVGGAAQEVAGVVVEPVQDLGIGAVGQLPVGEVGLPRLVRQFGLEAAVGTLRSLARVGVDGPVSGQDPRDRGRRDDGVLLLQVPADGVWAGVQALLGECLAQGEDAVDDRLGCRVR